MVFRDYLVRCKRCKVPYIPKNVSRIKTCIFCRRNPAEGKTERLSIILNDIETYIETQKALPTEAIIKMWIKLRFDLSDKMVTEYYNSLKKLNSKNAVIKEIAATATVALNA